MHVGVLYGYNGDLQMLFLRAASRGLRDGWAATRAMRAKGGARLPSGSGSASERQSGANWHGGCLDDNAPDVFFAVVGCELRRVGTRPKLPSFRLSP